MLCAAGLSLSLGLGVMPQAYAASSSTNTELEQLTNEVNKATSIFAKATEKSADLQAQVDTLADEIIALEQDVLPEKRQAASDAAVTLYKQQCDGGNLLSMLFSANSLSDLIELNKYLATIQSSNVRALEDFNKIHDELQEKLSNLSAAKDEALSQQRVADEALATAKEAHAKIEQKASSEDQQEAEAARKAAQAAVVKLHADFCPAGRMPVVIGNGFGGVIFHEACGHSLEATAVAFGNSEFCGKLGQKIASDKVTAIDDGTMPNEWGSSNVDDEGTPTTRLVLIENGVLKNYMVDRLNGRRMGMAPTGSGRRQDYTFAPTSRMRNTYIAPGDDEDDEIISSCGDGLYAKSMGGGSVNPVTGEFNFAVEEGYLIRDGKIDRPVRGATLIGRGADILPKIDRVGKDMKMAQGMCGSLSGSVPTNVGQPMIRVTDITVGGR